MSKSPYILQHSRYSLSSCKSCVLLSHMSKMMEYHRQLKRPEYLMCVFTEPYCSARGLNFGQPCTGVAKFPAKLVHRLTGKEQVDNA